MTRPMTPEEQSVIEEALAALGQLPKRRPITVAKVMGKIGADARTAVRFLSILERMDLLKRSGGDRGKPLLWKRKPAGPKALPAPTMQERAAAAGAARKLRSSLWDAAAMGAESLLHVDYSRPRRSAWIGMWDNLPGFCMENGRYRHDLLPGWQYTREEVTSEMIPDLEALAERGVRPTEATSSA